MNLLRDDVFAYTSSRLPTAARFGHCWEVHLVAHIGVHRRGATLLSQELELLEESFCRPEWWDWLTFGKTWRNGDHPWWRGMEPC